MKIVVLPGDGIGPETMAVAVDMLQAASRRYALGLELDHDVAGLMASLRRHGATVGRCLGTRAAGAAMVARLAQA